MNILLVNHLLDDVSGGGTSERTFQLARFMAHAGDRCTILTLDIGLRPQRRAALQFARLVAVPCLQERYFVPRITLEQVRGLVEEADVVLLSGYWTVLNAMVGQVCRQVGRPYLLAPAGALNPFGRSLWLKFVYDRLVGRSLVRGAAAFIAVTPAEREDFAAYDVSADRVVVIPNGVDSNDYPEDASGASQAAFRLGLGIGTQPYVLFLGRLNEIKGPDLLAQAFAQIAGVHPELHLVMAGPDGGMRAQLQAFFAVRGLQHRVHFPGYIGGQAKAAALRGARLLAIPSRREAMSIVVLEGGICTCPVLFTDACGLDDLAHRGAGTMVEATAPALAAGLEGLLALPDAAQAMAQALRRIVRDEYTWAAQAQRHRDLVRSIAGPAGDARNG